MRALSSVPVTKNKKKIDHNSLCNGDLVRVHLIEGLGEGKKTFIQGLYLRGAHAGIIGVQTTLSYRPVMLEWVESVEVMFSNID